MGKFRKDNQFQHTTERRINWIYTYYYLYHLFQGFIIPHSNRNKMTQLYTT